MSPTNRRRRRVVAAIAGVTAVGLLATACSDSGSEDSGEGLALISYTGQAGADGIAAGTIDWFTGPVPDVQNTNESFPDHEAFIQQQNQIVLATCSSAERGCEGPQTDPAVRHALYYAMNRAQTNKLAFQGTAGPISPAFTLTPSQDEFVSAEIVEDMPYVPVLTNATTNVWNTAKFTGWPSDEDLYAFPAVWSAYDAAEIYKHLKPIG